MILCWKPGVPPFLLGAPWPLRGGGKNEMGARQWRPRRERICLYTIRCDMLKTVSFR